MKAGSCFRVTRKCLLEILRNDEILSEVEERPTPICLGHGHRGDTRFVHATFAQEHRDQFLVAA